MKPLEIETREYYWKPMAAWFRSLELSTYRSSAVKCSGPILDLGCGDGKVSRMLQDLEIVEEPICGLDLHIGEVRKAKRENAHQNLLVATALSMPFKSDSFSTLFSNGVLQAIPSDLDKALAEIHRLLKEDGIFLGTVPTERFIECLIIPRILGPLSTKLRDLYVRRLNYRLGHFQHLSRVEWVALLRKNGLTLIDCLKFFSSRNVAVWNILSTQPFRVFGVFKLISFKPLSRMVSALLRALFRRLQRPRLSSSEPFAYILLVAKKATN